ncbi:hypothetical protein DPEC_G00305160 [Dallia pectoralis]|uniref:Uncharacterized protein n=1 Tax=Dallia pectoralis TaxID=75939 RepID=A0ACC2FDT8_DALPE|nr:hypothetical protein DPEC_G00305160 [Dallia pectoralis]
MSTWQRLPWGQRRVCGGWGGAVGVAAADALVSPLTSKQRRLLLEPGLLTFTSPSSTEAHSTSSMFTPQNFSAKVSRSAGDDTAGGSLGDTITVSRERKARITELPVSSGNEVLYIISVRRRVFAGDQWGHTVAHHNGRGR